jgi:predicted transcriptional regulator
MPYVPGMGKQQRIAVSLDVDEVADLDRIAAELGCSREELIEAAIHHFVDEQDPRPPYARLGFDSEVELDAYLKPALDDIAAGRTHSQGHVDALFDEMIARQHARAR